MNVSPLDLRQQRFNTGFRGFDKVEVASFLAAAADDYEQALRETDRLRQEVIRIEAMLTEHRDAEKNLKTTLLAAYKLADEIKATAEEEARRTLAEAEARSTFLKANGEEESRRMMADAESRSTMLLEKTQARVEDVQREIDGLRLKRKDVEATIESTIHALRNTLEFVREQETREREEKTMLRKVIG
jgi:cell division initiation protein